MPLTDEQIRQHIGPRMWCPKRNESTFAEGRSGPGLISYGVSSAGYDFRLGEKVLAFTDVHSVTIDPKKIDPRVFVPLEVQEATRLVTVDKLAVPQKERYVTIPPHGYVLAETVEYLEVPDDIIVVVLGKSTYARSGIIVNCTPLEPGWRGVTTLEIGNVSDAPARIYVGEGIAQALFFPLREWGEIKAAIPRKLYGQRSKRYQDQPGLTLPTTG